MQCQLCKDNIVVVETKLTFVMISIPSNVSQLHQHDVVSSQQKVITSIMITEWK